MIVEHAVSIELTPEEVSDILIEHLERLGYQVKDKPVIKINTVTTGYGLNERDSTVFNGVSVKAKEVGDIAKVYAKILNEDIQQAKRYCKVSLEIPRMKTRHPIKGVRADKGQEIVIEV